MRVQFLLINLAIATLPVLGVSNAVPFFQAPVVAQAIDPRKAEADALLQKGAVQAQSNQLAAAMQTWKEALALYRAIRDRRGEGTTLAQLSFAADALGDYQQAIAYLEQLRTYSQELGDRLGEGFALSRLGSAYLGLGKYDKAIDLHQQSLAIAQQLKNQAGAGQELRNLGIAYYSLENYNKAIDLHQQSLAIARALNDPQAEGISLVDLGTVYNAWGKPATAIDWLQQGLAIARKIQDRQGELSALGNLGLAYQAQKNYAKAIEVHQQSLAIARATKDPYGEGITLNNLGWAQFHAGQLVAAEQTLQTCIRVLETLRAKLGNNDAARVTIFDQQLRTYRTLQQVLIAQQKIDAALEIAEQGRARAFVELVARRLSAAIAPSSASATFRAGGELTKPPTIQQIRQIAKAQNATLVQYSVLYDDSKTTDKAQWQESRLYIWVVKPTGAVAFRQVDLTKAVQPAAIAQASSTPKSRGIPVLDHLVTQTHLALRGQPANRDAPFSRASDRIAFQADPFRIRRQLSQLHTLLIEPIADLLPTDPNDQVIFIPQGSLFFVPFPALRDANGQYLIERHTIRTAPSIQVLDLTRQQRQKLDPQSLLAKGTKALVVGNPTPLPNGWNELPYAEKEAKTIATLFETQPVLGQEATKAAIKQQMQQARLIHIAAHGQFEDQQGLGSLLVLAGTDPANSFLTADEMLDLQLQAELVVLSACQSGVGRLTGDGVIGLSRALIAAGTPSVLVSLWSVPDDSTNLLMTEFYQQLQKNPNKAQALRQAMLTLKTKNPIEWAAFTLIGEAE